MTKGTDTTPRRLTARYSLTGVQNMHRLQSQLRQQGASIQDIIDFANEADRTRAKLPGQIEPLAAAAVRVGAELHWID